MKTTLLATATFIATVTLLSAQTTNVPPGVPPTKTVRALLIPKVERQSLPSSLAYSNIAGLSTNVSRASARTIKPAPGGARAEFGLLKVFFPLDARDGPPLTITIAEGRTLACRATFLALHDLASGQSLLLAEVVTNRTGMIVGPHEVVYTNCFDTLHGSLRYRISPDGNTLEQDILIEESFEVPKEFSSEVRLEIWSAWYASEPVSKETQIIDLRAHDTSGLLPPAFMEDERLDFGSAKIVDGHAFGSTAQDERTPVGKTFVRIDGLDWLIETVDYMAVKSKLDLLPAGRRAAGLNQKSSTREALLRSLARLEAPDPLSTPRSRQGNEAQLAIGPASREQMRMAQATTSPQPEFVMDFIIVSSVPVPSGAISWWPGGGNANDAIVGSGNNGSWLGTAAYAAGKVGQGFSLGGANNAVTVPDTASLDFGPGQDFTVEAWIKPLANTNPEGIMSIIGKRYLGGIGYELFLINGELGFQIGDQVTFENWGVVGDLRDGQYHHIAVTVDRDDPDGGKLYVDGVAYTVPPTTISGDLSNGEPLRVGIHPDSSYGYFKGIIDEPAIYDRALGESEIQAIYNAGAAGKHNPTCIPAPTGILAWWPGDGNPLDLAHLNFSTLLDDTAYEPSVVSHGFSFDGDLDGVVIPHNTELNIGVGEDFTIEAWIKPLANGNLDGIMSIAGKRTQDGVGYELFLIDGQLGFQMGDLSVGPFNFGVPGELRDGGYHHVAVSVDRFLSADGLVLYVDGIPSFQSPPWPMEDLSNSEPFRIGVHPDSNYGSYNGTIDEVTVYRRALNQSEISALYSAGAAGKCKVDLDNDGVTDLQEAFLGTNAINPDSDADGIADGDEIDYQLNPLAPNSAIPPGPLNPATCPL